MNTFEVAFMHIPGKTNFKFPKKFHKWECSYEMLPLNHVFVFYRLHEVFNLQQSSWLKSKNLQKDFEKLLSPQLFLLLV